MSHRSVSKRFNSCPCVRFKLQTSEEFASMLGSYREMKAMQAWLSTRRKRKEKIPTSQEEMGVMASNPSGTTLVKFMCVIICRPYGVLAFSGRRLFANYRVKLCVRVNVQSFEHFAKDMLYSSQLRISTSPLENYGRRVPWFEFEVFPY